MFGNTATLVQDERAEHAGSKIGERSSNGGQGKNNIQLQKLKLNLHQKKLYLSVFPSALWSGMTSSAVSAKSVSWCNGFPRNCMWLGKTKVTGLTASHATCRKAERRWQKKKIPRFTMISIKRDFTFIIWNCKVQGTCLAYYCRQANKAPCVSSPWTSIQWICLLLHWQNSEN